MASLRCCLDETVRGDGRIVLVSGAVGMGKSEVVNTLADEAFGRGAIALCAACSIEESEFPLAVLGQLLQSAPLTSAERHRALGLLTEGMRGSLEQVDAHILDSLCVVLLELSERCPLLIVVDDYHNADRASQLCLSYLMRRIRFKHVMAVLTYPGAAQFAEELTRLPGCRRLRLEPLTASGVAQLAAPLGEDAAGQAADWHTITGGNPLLVRAVIADQPDIGDNYAAAVQACLRKIGPGLASIARALAVLGHPEGLDRLVELDSEVVGHGLRALERIGLLDRRHEFRHARGRSAVLNGMDGDALAALHRTAAELAFADGAPAEVVAEHLRATADKGGPWTSSVLAEAAHKALGDGRLSAAVDYLRLADRTCTDERRRAEIKTTLVRAEWQISPSAPSGYLTELADAMRGGHLRGADAVVLAKALMWHGRFDDAAAVLGQLAGSDDLDREAAAEIEATRPWLRCTYPPMTAHLPDAAADPGSPATAASVLRREAATALAAVLTGSPGATSAMDRILRGSRLDGLSMDTVECALLVMTFGVRPDQAAQWCDAYIEEAANRMAPSRQARLAAIRAETCLRLGDLLGAERYARLGLRLIPALSWGVALGAPISALLRAQTALGRGHEAAEVVARPVPDAMLRTRYGLQYLDAVGHYHLANGDLAVALRNFNAAGELMRSWSLDSPALVGWRLGAAETLLRMGRQGPARKLIERHLVLAGPAPSRAHGAALRLLAAAGTGEGRTQLLRRAADVLQEAGDRYELSRALADLADAYHRGGEVRRARTVRGQALGLAAECHAGPLIQQLSADGEAPVRSEPGLLSDAERRVADLAVIGYTNREIAGKLFITVSTVEQHLTKVYRKLNISRRSDLRPDRLIARQAG